MSSKHTTEPTEVEQSEVEKTAKAMTISARRAEMAHPVYVVDSQTDQLLWLNDINCVNAEIGDFFLDAGHSIAPETLMLCRACPVRMECLKHAYKANLTSGYFAGISPSQRRSLTLEEALKLIRRD